MISSFIHDKEQARLWELEQQLRGLCRANSGLVWLSSRTLTGTKLYRGSSETLRLARQLAAGGHLGRATARGRGRGKGRTLYWLPNTKKWLVLQELRREGMPHSAILQALGFYARRERVASAENVTDGTRQRSLGLTTFGTEPEKGTPARPARRSRAPSGPPRQAARRVVQDLSTPPSARRLVRQESVANAGLPYTSLAAVERLKREQLEAALQRIRRHVVTVAPSSSDTSHSDPRAG